MAENIDIGQHGEEEAAMYLSKNGYNIIARNWRYKHKEIDIIAIRNRMLIVVEVKTRTNDYFESPKEAVTRKKQRFIIEAANAYIEKNDIMLETQFDIVSVTIQDESIKIEHIEDAFSANML